MCDYVVMLNISVSIRKRFKNQFGFQIRDHFLGDLMLWNHFRGDLKFGIIFEETSNSGSFFRKSLLVESFSRRPHVVGFVELLHFADHPQQVLRHEVGSEKKINFNRPDIIVIWDKI